MRKDVQLTGNENSQAEPNPLLFSGSPDLFDSPTYWLNFPGLAYASWISSETCPVSNKRFADSTKKVRIAMWNCFIAYLAKNGVGLVDCTDARIEAFLQDENFEKEYAWRYIKLIERVYVHLNSLDICSINPARSTILFKFKKMFNDGKTFLTYQERNKLAIYLINTAHDCERVLAQCSRKIELSHNYLAILSAMRDAAMCAVQIGAGVTVGELVRLTVNCTSEIGEVWVPRCGSDLERRIKIDDDTAEIIRVWRLFLDRHRSVFGRVLFPAMIPKRRKDQQTRTAAMHPSTVFRRTSKLLGRLGIIHARSCSQTLRNTYCASLIESGANDQMIMDAMGYTGDLTLPRLRFDHGTFYGYINTGD